MCLAVRGGKHPLSVLIKISCMIGTKQLWNRNRAICFSPEKRYDEMGGKHAYGEDHD
jgi:hypothetical protein